MRGGYAAVIYFDNIFVTQHLRKSEMLGRAGRFKGRIVVAVLVLSIAAPLFAQGAAPSSNFPWLSIIAVVFTVFSLVFWGWLIRYVWLKLVGSHEKRKNLPGKSDLTQPSGSPPAANRAQASYTKDATISEVPTRPLGKPLATMPDPVPHTEKSNRSIFISYRRHDSQHITGRIYDRLSTKFGKDAVFKDVDSIPLGIDFREHIREQVSRCAVLIAVIGKSWGDSSATGNPRLNDPGDHLRIEIEAALERRIPVIPVLVDGVEMPSEEELPPSLGRLAYHNGISVRPDPDFHSDADRLLRGIESLLR
jgi:hypothetical protein